MTDNNKKRQHFPQSPAPRDMTKCFVMMPIKKGFDEVYDHVIKPLLNDLGIKAIRGDEIYSANPIIEDIWDQIQTCSWLIADLTGKNPNVLYELGLCHGNNREVILVTQSIDDVPFDLQHWRCIIYDQSIAGAESLKSALQKMFIEDSTYVHVPVALLTEKFKDGFRVLDVTTNVHLSGACGSLATFEENWSIVPTRPGVLKEFFRKIQTSGSLANVSCNGCDVQMSKFMEGVFLLTMTPTQSTESDNVVSYQLKYEIENGFPFGEEFWNFDFDCLTECFQVNKLPRRKRTGYPFEEDSFSYRRKRRGIQPKEI